MLDGVTVMKDEQSNSERYVFGKAWSCLRAIVVHWPFLKEGSAKCGLYICAGRNNMKSSPTAPD